MLGKSSLRLINCGRSSTEDEDLSPVTRFQRLGQSCWRRYDVSSQGSEPTAMPAPEYVQGTLLRASTVPSLQAVLEDPITMKAVGLEEEDSEWSCLMADNAGVCGREWGPIISFGEAVDLQMSMHLEGAEHQELSGREGSEVKCQAGDQTPLAQRFSHILHSAETSLTISKASDAQLLPQPLKDALPEAGNRKASTSFLSADKESIDKEKRRAAQRRFRERQRGTLLNLERKVKQLEYEVGLAAVLEEQQMQQAAALSAEALQLQSEVNRMHLQEAKLGNLTVQLAELRHSSGPGREDRLQHIVAELSKLHMGSKGSELQPAMRKVLSFMHPPDFDATEAGLLRLLESPSEDYNLAVQPSELKITLHKAANGDNGARVLSVAEVMDMPAETFRSLFKVYASSLAQKCKACPLAEVARDPYVTKLTSELRAIECCFNALHPAEASMQQLRHLETGKIVGDEANHRTLWKLLGSLQLTPVQLDTLRQLAFRFKKRQTEVQAERRELLVAAQGALYATKSPMSQVTRTLDAIHLLHKNQEEDVFNVSQLTAHFITRVLTPVQLFQLTVTAYPHTLNIMGLIQLFINQWPVVHAGRTGSLSI